MEGIRSPVVGLFVVAEDTVGTEAPDFTDLLAFVVIPQGVVGILKLGYPGTAVPETTLDAVLEGFAGQVELVSPGNRELPAVGLEGAIVALRRIGAI